MDEAKMSDYEYYIQQLGGPNEDNAFHSLIEADSAVIPDLVAAYRLEVSPRKRAVLIEIIGYHRETASVDFLADALQEKEPDIWKAALDALVTINHPTALNALLGASRFQGIRRHCSVRVGGRGYPTTPRKPWPDRLELALPLQGSYPHYLILLRLAARIHHVKPLKRLRVVQAEQNGVFASP